MALTDELRPYSPEARAGRRSQRRLGGPAIIGAVAVGEGLLAAAIFLGVALVYNLVGLKTPVTEFAWTLYLLFGLGLGLAYAGVSANAASKFFEGERNSFSTLPSAAVDWTMAFAGMLLAMFLTGVIGDLSRLSLTVSYLLGISLAVSSRGLLQALLLQRINRGELHFQKIAVVGERLSVLQFLLGGNLWRHGQSIVGTLYLEDLVDESGPDLDKIDRFAEQVTRQGASYIVIASDVTELRRTTPLLTEFKRYSLNVVYALDKGDDTVDFIDIVSIGPANTLRVLKRPLDGLSVFFKRALDIFGAVGGLVVLSPFFAAAALLIKLENPGPVLFRQERRGFNGRAFFILKFRSMRVTEPGHAMQQATRGDARVTRIGRIMRATSFDELPQLINVLRGEMSLVGPRPHALSHDTEMGRQVAEYAYRRRMKPGITGWAQVNGYRGETRTIDQIQGRTRYDLFYVENWSLLFDLWVLLLTVFSPGARRNAY